VTGLRRRARIIALQALYEIDCIAHKSDEILDRCQREQTLSKETADFARRLVAGIILNKNSIDNTIREFAPLFPLEQIAIIDRNILRIAIFEILFDNEVPVKVAIDEAVELAKSFGSDHSPRFVNGVLGSVINKCMVSKKVCNQVGASKSEG